MAIAIYQRFSTEEQIGGQSIAMQKRACEEFIAKRPEWKNEAVDFFPDEAKSGGGFDRPAFKRMEAAVKAGKYRAVITYKFDRFSRSAPEGEMKLRWFAHWGAPVFSATEPEHPLIRQLFGVTNELERAKCIERTRDGLRENAEAGWWNGHAPFGYRLEYVELSSAKKGRRTTLVIDVDQAQTVKRIFELYARGRLGMAGIAAKLNCEGIPAYKGGTWEAGSVRVILRNSIYAGLRIARKYEVIRDPENKKHRRIRPADEWIKQPRPEWQIIPTDLWDAADKLFQARHQAKKTGDSNTANRLRHSRYLTTGIVRCSCGACMTGEQARGGSGRMSYYLTCPRARRSGPAVCTNRTRYPMVDVEDAILGAVEERVFGPGAVEKLLAYTVEALEVGVKDAAELRLTLQRDLGDVERRIANLVNALADGKISIAPIRAGIADLEAQKTALVAKLAELEATGDVEKRKGWLEAARSRLERTADLFRRIRGREIPASEEFRAILGGASRQGGPGARGGRLQAGGGVGPTGRIFRSYGLGTPRGT